MSNIEKTGPKFVLSYFLEADLEMSKIFQKHLCDKNWLCCNEVIYFPNSICYLEGKAKRGCIVEYTHTHTHTRTESPGSIYGIHLNL